MSKFARTAPDPAIVTDPELARLEKRMQALHELAEQRMAEIEALSKDIKVRMEHVDRFIRLSEEVTRAIGQCHTLRQRYQRRREKLEAERERRVAAARTAFLAAGTPSDGTRH